MFDSVMGILAPASVAGLAAWLIDKIIAALVSAIVAFAILQIGRARELRKLSLEMYKEFYSLEFSKQRYEAERFLDKHSQHDWRFTDPYTLDDAEGTRVGYASVTRYFARLSILYKEKELNRIFVEKTLSRMAGYWWGLVYERMTDRTSMYTAKDLKYIFGALEKGCRSEEFAKGVKDGTARRSVKVSASATTIGQTTAGALKDVDASLLDCTSYAPPLQRDD